MNTRHPLYYATLPGHQNARWAQARRLRAICRLLVSAILLGILGGLFAYGFVSCGASLVLHFLSR